MMTDSAILPQTQFKEHLPAQVLVFDDSKIYLEAITQTLNADKDNLQVQTVSNFKVFNEIAHLITWDVIITLYAVYPAVLDILETHRANTIVIVLYEAHEEADALSLATSLSKTASTNSKICDVLPITEHKRLPLVLYRELQLKALQHQAEKQAETPKLHQYATYLKRSEERFRTVIEGFNDIILMVDQYYIIRYTNNATTRVMGYPTSDLLGKTIQSFLDVNERTPVTNKLGSVLQVLGSIQTLEHQMRHASGCWQIMETTAHSIDDPLGQAVLILHVRDITLRKQAEIALQQSHDTLEHQVLERTAELQAINNQVEGILNNTPEGILLLDRDWVIQQMNMGMCNLFFCGVDEYKNQSLFNLIQTNEIGQFQQFFQQVMVSSNVSSIEVHMSREDGAVFLAEVNLGLIKGDGIVATIRDITLRKQIETQLYETIRKEKELNELKSRFVSMASHEFRNPFATIFAITETLLAYREKMSVSQIDQRLGKIQTQITHLKDIMDDVLLLARLQARRTEFSPQNFTSAELIDLVLEDFRDRPEIQERLNWDFHDLPPVMNLDKKIIHQVSANLISNALKYSPSDKPITVQILYQDGNLELSVRDQGIGIPEADLEHLFEPFHRAANVGSIHGTGLGLVITKESVDLHGGTISVESQVGVGTCFTVQIPSRAANQLNSPP